MAGSHSTSLGRVVEEVYVEGGSSTKEFKGVKTTVTYHWEGDVLTYVAVKEVRRLAPLDRAWGAPLARLPLSRLSSSAVQRCLAWKEAWH